jgi:hypothetical protein
MLNVTIQQAATDLNNLIRVRIEDTCTDCAAIYVKLGCDAMAARLRGIAIAAREGSSDFTPVVSELERLEVTVSHMGIPDATEKIQVLMRWIETTLLDFCNKVVGRG